MWVETAYQETVKLLGSIVQYCGQTLSQCELPLIWAELPQQTAETGSSQGDICFCSLALQQCGVARQLAALPQWSPVLPLPPVLLLLPFPRRLLSPAWSLAPQDLLMIQPWGRRGGHQLPF